MRSKVCNLWSLALIISARKSGSPVGTRLSSLSTFFAKQSHDFFEKTPNASANVIQGVWFVKMVLIIQIGKNCPPSGNWSKHALKLLVAKKMQKTLFFNSLVGAPHEDNDFVTFGPKKCAQKIATFSTLAIGFCAIPIVRPQWPRRHQVKNILAHKISKKRKKYGKAFVFTAFVFTI